MQQGVQTDATSSIQLCWDLLANNVGTLNVLLSKQSQKI